MTLPWLIPAIIISTLACAIGAVLIVEWIQMRGQMRDRG
jgi:hypothetical protein